MTENVCKNCNAPLDMAEAKNGVIVCAFCGSAFTLPKKEQPPAVVKALDFGYAALDKCRFDDAYTHFASAAELTGASRRRTGARLSLSSGCSTCATR